MGFELPNSLAAFISEAGWQKATCTPLAQDASTRQYFRLQKDNQTAILLSAPIAGEEPLCLPEMTKTQRQSAGYSALARLAGNDCVAFLAIARELSNRGFSTPAILHAKPEQGLILLEDLGDDLFANIAKINPDNERQIYQAAVSTLAALARASFRTNFQYQQQHWPVLHYDRTALLAEVELLCQWYLPEQNLTVSSALQADLLQAWQQVFDTIKPGAEVLVLRDFHAQNLIWLPKRAGHANVGLLDFQDAVFGHPAYDLVSLLQDARRDVPMELEMPMIEAFLQQAKINDKSAFLRAYRILGAQRAAKILGIFVRLARRDHKQHYLALLPRVEQHFAQNLQHPELAPLRAILHPVLPKLLGQFI